MSDIVAVRARSRTVLSPLVIACLAATWFIWGSGYLAIKVTLTGFPPFLMMGPRFSAAGVTHAKLPTLWCSWIAAQ
jgi:hypothetical protein